MQEKLGYKAVVYYTNWAIYGREHHAQDLPADRLTHVLYAFANVKPDTGEVFLSDTWSDIEKHYPNDSWNDPGTNIYGCLKQLALQKRRHRTLKTLLSIGGWTYSPNFAHPASTPQGRRTFASTAVSLLADLGFDGLDVDWEYPATDSEAADYVSLLAETRAALNAYADRIGHSRKRYLLTIASPAGTENYKRMHIREMDAHLDFWNMMAYDYSGSWDATAGHMANVRASREDPASTPFNTVDAFRYYVEQCGVKPHKIVLGCPLYGRAFCNTRGLGHPYQGVGGGSWENGCWDWKDLPRKGRELKVDEHAVASWEWSTQEGGCVVSFDSLDVGKKKAQWIKENGLGGVMWWESSGDKSRREESMIEAVVSVLDGRGGEMEKIFNVIDYPESKYDNLRKGFPGEV